MPDRFDIGDWCTLYHADSVEIVDTLREHAPDAVIMDPPYGIKADHSGKAGQNGRFQGKGRPRRILVGDDEGADIRVWVNFAPGVLLWGAEHLRRFLPRQGGRFLVWDKLAGFEPWDSFSDAECAWQNREGKTRIISHLWKGLSASKKGGEENGLREHPMQKPIRVMEWCIEQCRLEPGAADPRSVHGQRHDWPSRRSSGA